MSVTFDSFYINFLFPSQFSNLSQVEAGGPELLEEAYQQVAGLALCAAEAVPEVLPEAAVVLGVAGLAAAVRAQVRAGGALHAARVEPALPRAGLGHQRHAHGLAGAGAGVAHVAEEDVDPPRRALVLVTPGPEPAPLLQHRARLLLPCLCLHMLEYCHRDEEKDY